MAFFHRLHSALGWKDSPGHKYRVEKTSSTIAPYSRARTLCQQGVPANSPRRPQSRCSCAAIHSTGRIPSPGRGVGCSLESERSRVASASFLTRSCWLTGAVRAGRRLSNLLPVNDTGYNRVLFGAQRRGIAPRSISVSMNYRSHRHSGRKSTTCAGSRQRMCGSTS